MYARSVCPPPRCVRRDLTEIVTRGVEQGQVNPFEGEEAIPHREARRGEGVEREQGAREQAEHLRAGGHRDQACMQPR